MSLGMRARPAKLPRNTWREQIATGGEPPSRLTPPTQGAPAQCGLGLVWSDLVWRGAGAGVLALVSVSFGMGVGAGVGVPVVSSLALVRVDATPRSTAGPNLLDSKCAMKQELPEEET